MSRAFLLVFIITAAHLLYAENVGNNGHTGQDPPYENGSEDTTDTTPEAVSEVNSECAEKVRALQQENPDVKGWITIDDTIIDYPLLQGTDNDYYFTHNYKKEASKYGSIMIHKMSDIRDIHSNIIIYGHNMKDGLMFSSLLQYERQDFYREHPLVKIVTEANEAAYQIMYVFKSQVFYAHETDVFRYYQYYDFDHESIYHEYLHNCRESQLYDTGITAEYGDQLITLITCEYSQDNGRLVVVGKKVTSSPETPMTD
jgi:sortase B